jgi:hypothetical protein
MSEDAQNTVDLRERVAICNDFTAPERNLILAALNAYATDPATTRIETPQNYLGRIEHLWAALSVDDGGEGLCAAPMVRGTLTMPLIAADKRRLEQIRPFAKSLARVTERVVRIVKFGSREDVEIFRP